MERREMHKGYWWESQRERDHLEDQDVGWWIILRLIFGERMEWSELDSSGSG
jgi:hypothetical protein